MDIFLLLFGALILLLLFVVIIIFMGNLIRARLVPYIDSSDENINLLRDHITIKPDDVIIELGCGDARVLSTLTNNNQYKSARGYEVAFYPYFKAKKRRQNDQNRYEVHRKNFMEQDLSDGTIFYSYMLSHFMKPIWKKLYRECKPGTLLYSNAFEIPGVTPVREIKKEISPKEKRVIYVYQV